MFIPIDDTVCSGAYVAMRQSNLVWGGWLGIVMEWMVRSENGVMLRVQVILSSGFVFLLMHILIFDRLNE